MSQFIDDTIPPLEIDRSRVSEILVAIAAIWPAEVNCDEKSVGIDNYSCLILTQPSRRVREEFEQCDWGEDIERAGVAIDFFGLAMKNASGYLRVIRTEDIDLDIVISNIGSRDDILVK